MAALPVVDIRDKRIGIASALFVVALVILYLFLKTFQMADPPPKDFIMKAETVIEEVVLKNLKVETGGAGGGEPSDDKIAPPTPQTQQILTKPTNPKTQTNTGKGSHTNSPNSQNTPTTTTQSNNPFATGGNSNNTGGGTGPFGQDAGSSGTGPGGSGNGDGRTRLNDPHVEHIETNVNVTIYLKLTVNADGNVVSAVSTSKTTTTDQRIINQVIAAVKSQVKYNKDPGAGLVSVFLTVRINAT